MKRALVIAVFLNGLALCTALHADDFVDLVDKGNRAFVDGDYKAALDNYHQAEVERPETPELYYNIGTALYKEGKYEEAVDKLQKSMATESIEYEANALYNRGNVYYKMGDYQNAIMSYQSSLELNPEDMDTKYNLELARKMLKEQIKPEQQDQQQQQQQQQQPQPQEEEEQQQEQQQPQEDEPQEEQQQQPQPQPQQVDEDEMSKEDAERILNALKDDEKDLQKEQNRFNAQGDYQGNDW